MKNGKLRIVIGIILVLLQIVAVLGLQETNVDLWDTIDSTLSDFTPEPTALTFSMWAHGFYNGRDKWCSVFLELPDALEEEGYYFHDTLSEEITGAKIREGLAAGGHPFQRILYDLNLLAGFYLFGILGALLLISGVLAWRNREDLDDPGCADLLEGRFASRLRIPGAVVCFLCLLLQLPTEAGFLPEDIFALISYSCMGVFFLFYYGKKPSVLPAAALLITGGVLLESGLYSFTPIFSADTATQLTYYGLIFILFTAAGILYLICGAKLNRRNTKAPLKWPFAAGAAAELMFYIYYVSQFAKFPVRMLKELMTCLPSILFLVLMGLYIWLVRDIPVVYRSDIPHQEPIPEGCCPMCRAPFTPGKTQCSRCGAALPGTAGSEEAPAKHTVRYCHNCGNMLEKDNRFCGQCGTPVWQPTETK